MSSQRVQFLRQLKPLQVCTGPSPAPLAKAGWRALAEARLRARQAPLRKAHAVRLSADIAGIAQKLGARRVGLYSPLGAETETRDLANTLIALGIDLAYPRLRADGLAIDFCECAGPATLVARPRSRLLEPQGPAIAPEELDLVVVPALAIGPDLVRLGRGGGHFDRYLPLLRPDAMTIAVAAAECLLDWLPRERHDVVVHCVATEAGVFGPAQVVPDGTTQA